MFLLSPFFSNVVQRLLSWSSIPRADAKFASANIGKKFTALLYVNLQLCIMQDKV